ncbi:microtubule-associated protein futsch [Eurytemora carolleeae]|uniref:microtubule-associated protein futsch n=1 Tax=Eurytemora carolleeae TaxID=1294199 RepID=UPI000C780047|nr:microtubule-associated protein futsch [Eurytemora carolleeae]|eukprot:XP_023324972.1 microtubule-associated protein futsch-like [Eurytemora affinis]
MWEPNPVLVQPPALAVSWRMADPPQLTGACMDPPQLSPLSGAYLMIVVGEPFSEEHKQLILRKIEQGLKSWDISEVHVDLEKELSVITDCAPPGEEARGGERLIQFATENLVTEVLIHPQVNTLQQCMKNMLGSFTKHRHIIHAGYTFAAQGSWILQDGNFSNEEFVSVFEEYDVQRVIRSFERSISIHLHCCPRGDWNQDVMNQQPFSKLCQVSVNPETAFKDSEPVSQFINYLDPFLQPQSIQERLPPSDVVGNIRFSHPTLYVFPGGQGDSALFGINGFNMLIDGGFSRKACFWDFTRHLDRLDAILITRLNDENTQGINAVLERKVVNNVYPQIGHFFANLVVGEGEVEKKDEADKDQLLVNVVHEANSMIENLRILNLKPQICFRDNVCDPINLYHKVGHGKLDMYVLNPSKDSREVKEFMSRWSEDGGHLGTFKSGINVDGKELWLPIANLVSVCALVVWHPANPNDTITRLLFPGSTPQNKIFKGLEKLKKLECLKYSTCSANTLQQAKSKQPTQTKEFEMKKEKVFKPQQSEEEKIAKQEKLAKKKKEKLRRAKEEKNQF